MAQVLVQKNVFKIKFELESYDGNEEATRELTFDVFQNISDAAAQEARFNAFKNAYMSQFANSSYDEEGTETNVGSLIQKANWRDAAETPAETENALKCTGITGSYVQTIERQFVPD